MKKIQTISDLIRVINHYYTLLNEKIEFDSMGWPIFRKEHFLSDWPDDMIIYDRRNDWRIQSKSTTLLCLFTGDLQNYRRFVHLEKNLSIYKEFLGVVFPDITVTKDMDPEFQDLIILANHLFAAVLAVNGVKLVFNTRTGSKLSSYRFTNIPRGIPCASGFLGCGSSSNIFETSEYINKILQLRPSKLLIYGKQDSHINEQLDILGINYRYFVDFHRRCKKEVV